MRGTVEYLAGADLWSSQKDIQETHTLNEIQLFFILKEG
jgi:hypothetical protein